MSLTDFLPSQGQIKETHSLKPYNINTNLDV